MPTMQYVGVDDFKDALRITHDGFDGLIDTIVSSASRQVDEYCVDQFWRAEPATARTFVAESPYSLWTGSFASTDDLVVEFDGDDDGVFEELVPASGWQAEITGVSPGRPYRRLGFFHPHQLPGTSRWACALGARRARVRVTAHWGWSAVPSQVRQACLLLAIDQFKAKDLMDGATRTGFGTAGGGLGTQKRHVDVVSGAFNPVAAGLLADLRLCDVVIA